MVELPQFRDRTLVSCDQAYENRYNEGRSERPYLGMSAVGGECARQLWYSFRWMKREVYDIASIKRFADGHLTEEVAIDRLMENAALVVEPVDPITGEQFGYQDFGGHLRGHMDGKISGLIEAPKTQHVLEIKAVGEKNYRKLAKIIEEVGEKAALQKWNAVYYGQAQLYMFYGALTRHFTVVCSPGGREWTSIRTDFCKADAEAIRTKAETIIFNERPPERVATSSDFYLCRFCPSAELCWTDPTKADRTCRGCAHTTPERKGGWSCALRPKEVLSENLQRQGCGAHAHHPSALWDREAEATEWDIANLRHNITYRLKDGTMWTDKGGAHGQPQT